MKLLLIFLGLLVYSGCLTQIEDGKYYHYRTDQYYDTLMHNSSWSDFIFVKKGVIAKGQIQTKESIEYDYQEWVDYGEEDSLPPIQYDALGRLEAPYSLITKGDRVFISFLHYYSNTDTVLPMYPLDFKDTIKHVFDMNYLFSESSSQWISKKGKMMLLSDTVIEILDQPISCFVFKHEEKGIAACKRTNQTKIIYLDKESLIPVKTITHSYWTQTDKVLKNYSVEYIDSMSTDPPYHDFDENLTIFYDPAKIWTQNQKNEFFRINSNWTSKEECECAINKVQGNVGFFNAVLHYRNRHWESRLIMKALDECQKK